MPKNIFTTSATIKYLAVRDKVTLEAISKVIGESVEAVTAMLKGKEKFTKEHYVKLVDEFSYLEGCIEMFENVKLKDIKEK